MAAYRVGNRRGSRRRIGLRWSTAPLADFALLRTNHFISAVGVTFVTSLAFVGLLLAFDEWMRPVSDLSILHSSSEFALF
ncbi:hypothetical protein [Stenotrophomonas sp. HMWF003]|uniref:hypothetical protein n=1 Tax=Stenotrophomonas sp. HMWF003 TaxID=2056840 RepID=UPI000FE2213E|nr:hypothetical protein [Stenotrophomonas sp. HMWF003]